MNVYAVGVTTPTVSEGLGPSRVVAADEEDAKRVFASEEGRDVAGLEAAGMTQWMVILIGDAVTAPRPEPEPEPAPLPEPVEPEPVEPDPDEPVLDPDAPVIDPESDEVAETTVLPEGTPQEEETP